MNEEEINKAIGNENINGIAVKVEYKNWKGEVAERNIIPLEVYFGSTEYYKEKQWLMKVYDLDKKDYRTYSLNHIQKWIKLPVIKNDVDKTKIHEKGWGREEWIANNEKYCGKKLILLKDRKCSIHFHKIKDETFFVQSGLVRMDLYPQQKDLTLIPGGYPNNQKKLILKPGDVIKMPQFTPHRFWGLEDSEMFEFSTHHEEEDSYRLEDGDSQKHS